MIDVGSLEGERESMLTVGEAERLEKAPRKRKSYRLKRIKTPAKKKSSAAVSYNDAKHQHSTKRVNDHLDMNQIIQAINLNLLIKLNEGSNTYSNQIPWNRIGRNDMVNWPENVPVKKIFLQGRKNLKEIYTNLDRIQFTKEFLNNWAARLNRMARVPSPLPVKGSQLVNHEQFNDGLSNTDNLLIKAPSQGDFNRAEITSLDGEGEDAGSSSSLLFDDKINDSLFYKSRKTANKPYISGDEHSQGSDSFSDHGQYSTNEAQLAGDSVSKNGEESIYDSEEIPDLPLQDGNLIFN
jgi:hypothetical protein